MQQEPYEKTVTKHCIECSTPFTITGIISGSGSHAKFNKVFCGNACKRAYKKHNTSRTKVQPVELTCKICDKIFYLPPSQAKSASTCSNECRHKLNGLRLTRPREKRQCSRCDQQFECKVNSKRKYCSLICSRRPKLERFTIPCVICDADIEVRESQMKRSKVLTCSRKCQYAAQSSGIIKFHVSGRVGYRSDLNDGNYYKSALEADFARWCVAVGKQYAYEHHTFIVEVDGKKRCYTPDFYIPDEVRYIELKGIKPFTDEQRRLITVVNTNVKAAHALRKSGINIDIIYQVDFHKSLKNTGMWRSMPIIETKNHRMHKDVVVKRAS